MNYALSILISVIAIIFVLIKIPAFKAIRIFFIIVSLGAGQIYLAFLALSLFLLFEVSISSLKKTSIKILLITIIFYYIAFFLTLISSIDDRKASELVQLLIYIFLFYQMIRFLALQQTIDDFLLFSIYASVTIAFFGLLLNYIGQTEAPGIFLERGGNEGSTFLLFMGLIPCLTLYLKSRQLKFILLASLIIYAQYMATSRANYLLSLACFVCTIIFLFKHIWHRLLIIFFIVTILIINKSIISELVESAQNYSTIQRLLLYEAGYELAIERPWTGWGWGSTSKLALESRFTDLSYPHFHSTFVQLIVELGLMGLFIICIWTISMILFVSKSMFFYNKLPLHYNLYIVLSFIALFFTGFTETLIFGADRAIIVIFVFSIIINLLKIKSTSSSMKKD